MAHTLDFTKQKKEYLTVKLNDDKGTVLMIGTPTKRILEEFVSINEQLGDNNGMTSDVVNDVYTVCAKIMSFNKGGIKITPEYLGEFFDLGDITLFFEVYGEFMTTVTGAKN